MEYSDNAVLKLENYKGNGQIVYSDTDGRFFIRRKASDSPAGVAVGMMFGMIGQAVMNSVNDSVELATFTPNEIGQMVVTDKKRKLVYTLYPASGAAPYELTLKKKADMNAVLQQVLANAAGGGVSQDWGQTAPEVNNAPAQQYAPENMTYADQPLMPFSEHQPVDFEPFMQQPAPQPSVQPPAPQPPVQQPEQQYAPQPPVQQYTPQPPVQQYTPQPPAQQYAPQPQMQQRGGALICLRSGVMAGRIFSVGTGTKVLVGRDAARCQVALPRYGTVSGVHCSIEVGDRCLRVMDMNSTNGTFVNDKRLAPNQPAILRAGDTMKLGDETCVFLVDFE